MKRIMHKKYLKKSNINEKLEFITPNGLLYRIVVSNNRSLTDSETKFNYTNAITGEDSSTYEFSSTEILKSLQNKYNYWTHKSYIMKIV